MRDDVLLQGDRAWIVDRLPLHRRECQPKSDTPVVRVRGNPVAPPHGTVNVPVVMTSTAEPPLRARTEPRRSVARHSVDVVDADVLTPLPHVAGHVIDAKLIWRLCRDIVRARGLLESRAEKPAAESHS